MGRCLEMAKTRSLGWGRFHLQNKNARKMRLVMTAISPLAHVNDERGPFYANTAHPYTLLHPERQQ
jgi:hypothetical protein